MKPDHSTRKRTITKVLSWESFSTTVCFGIAYMMFGNVGCCAVFAVICFLVKLVLFYGHERIWHQVSWGKKP